MGSITTPVPASQSSQVRACTTCELATNAPVKYRSIVNSLMGFLLQSFNILYLTLTLNKRELFNHICVHLYILHCIQHFQYFFVMI